MSLIDKVQAAVSKKTVHSQWAVNLPDDQYQQYMEFLDWYTAFPTKNRPKSAPQVLKLIEETFGSCPSESAFHRDLRRHKNA